MAVTHKSTLRRIIKMTETRTCCGVICPWSEDQETFSFCDGNPRTLIPIYIAYRYNHPRCISCRTVMKIDNPEYEEKCPCQYYYRDWDQILRIVEERRAEYNL
jgi:hypothetical protein